MTRAHRYTLMRRDELPISDVAQRIGLNRGIITAIYDEPSTRVDLAAIESLCNLVRFQVGELFEVVPPKPKAQI